MLMRAGRMVRVRATYDFVKFFNGFDVFYHSLSRQAAGGSLWVVESCCSLKAEVEVFITPLTLISWSRVCHVGKDE